MTDQERLEAILTKTRVALEDRGVFKNKWSDLHSKWRAAGLDHHEHCAACGNKLPPHLRKWCSGTCKEKDATLTP